MNADDCFGKYKSKDDMLNCVNSVNCYANTYQYHCTKSNDFLLRIIFSFDKSALSNGRIPIALLKFTTTLLNQNCRNKASTWRYLGFINDFSSFQSAVKRMSLSAEEKYHLNHQLFNAVLPLYLQVHLIHKGI